MKICVFNKQIDLHYCRLHMGQKYVLTQVTCGKLGRKKVKMYDNRSVKTENNNFISFTTFVGDNFVLFSHMCQLDTASLSLTQFREYRSCRENLSLHVSVRLALIPHRSPLLIRIFFCIHFYVHCSM